MSESEVGSDVQTNSTADVEVEMSAAVADCTEEVAAAGEVTRRQEEEARLQQEIREEMIATIVQQSGQPDTEEQVRQECQQFYQKYPGGEISKDEFLRENKVSKEFCVNESLYLLFLCNLQSLLLAESLFRIFDCDENNCLNYYEWRAVRRAASLTTVEEKLDWIFDAFDLDGGGSIDVLEVKRDWAIKM